MYLLFIYQIYSLQYTKIMLLVKKHTDCDLNISFSLFAFRILK